MHVCNNVHAWLHISCMQDIKHIQTHIYLTEFHLQFAVFKTKLNLRYDEVIRKLQACKQIQNMHACKLIVTIKVH